LHRAPAHSKGARRWQRQLQARRNLRRTLSDALYREQAVTRLAPCRQMCYI